MEINDKNYTTISVQIHKDLKSRIKTELERIKKDTGRRVTLSDYMREKLIESLSK